MAATKASTTTAKKAERKKPVRTAPVQKDYPSKMAWLQAMLEHEAKQSSASDEAKVKRLDKRIAAKRALIAEHETALAKLLAAKEELAPTEEDEELVDGMTDEEHLAAEGKA
jgi:uncharacterized protein involved in exopolysaccharide biosynthesis